MSEVLKKLFLIAAALSLFIPGCATPPALADSKSLQDSQIIVSTELKDVSESDIERVRKEAQKALDSIPPLLGIEYKKKIKIEIVAKGICNARGGVVSLPIWHVRNKRAAIIHEVSHIIARKHENNRFFSEGLAVFLQYKYGEDRSALEYYKEPLNFSLDDLVRKYRDNLISLSYLKNNNDVFKNIDEPLTRKLPYTEAGSFIKFLYEVYGSQKFQDLYSSWTLNYEKVYGKKFKDLETEWLIYVLQ